MTETGDMRYPHPEESTIRGMVCGERMRVGLLRVALAGALAGGLVAACFGPSHPDTSRYEYMYINGVFQPPYTTFPSGTDRANWKCYDGKTNKEYDCTFVRGGWDYYQYIYRARK